MKRKFTRTIGEIVYNEQYGFFYGYVNGMKVTMNQALKDGQPILNDKGLPKWFVKEEMEVWEVEDKGRG